MDYNSIKLLLNKYFDGETSLEEEHRLQQYFRQEAVHESLLPYRVLFQMLDEERQRELNPAFTRRLLEKLQATEAPRVRVVYLRTWLARAAAVLLLAAGAWWLYPKVQAPPKQPVAQAIDWSKYEPETPEKAYQMLKKALVKTSDELNHGTETVVKEVEKIQKVNEVLN
jgi:hypothetical protein